MSLIEMALRRASRRPAPDPPGQPVLSPEGAAPRGALIGGGAALAAALLVAFLLGRGLFTGPPTPLLPRAPEEVQGPAEPAPSAAPRQAATSPPASASAAPSPRAAAPKAPPAPARPRRPTPSPARRTAGRARGTPARQGEEVQELLRRAYLCARRGELRQALALYDRVLARSPQRVDALINRGVVRQRLGQLQLARRDLERAYELGSRDPTLFNALGALYLRLGQPERARKLLERAGTAEAEVNLALLSWQRGELEEVALHLQRAQELDPYDPYVHFYWYRWWEQRGDARRALQHLALCRQLAEQRGAQELLRRLPPS